MSRHSPRARAALLAAAVLALLAGCKEPPGSSLFPLEEGRRWTYRLSSEWENDTRERETVVLSNLGRDSALESGSAWHRRSDTGLDYWLRADATGIYRVAAKSDVDAEPKPDPAPRFVLKAPIAVGTSWQTTTTTYLMRRNSEFPPEIRHAHPSVPVVWTIEALDDRVEVPAGRFEQCVRVKGLALLRLFADPVNGFKDMPLTTLEWYCPGVGLVKVERREPANSTFLTGGTMTMELMEWQ
ncbi:MAG: hypothetical protein U1F21_11905 [Sphaerotilus natans]|jgi:hypothetical protein|uniref:hypothetical protein n=1 Tax=Sphaerotilus sp. FB-3 TaxID=2913396 RepID=UPI001B5319B2|nr:hypothetical protein [Sphaerotilus sp. FB-3]MBP8175401.1 hypothetical protein [Sphaerotilus sp.]GKQ59389.1 hypothetical protein QMTAC487_32500 [Sphaerotilus sp. FB-3]